MALGVEPGVKTGFDGLLVAVGLKLAMMDSETLHRRSLRKIQRSVSLPSLSTRTMPAAGTQGNQHLLLKSFRRDETTSNSEVVKLIATVLEARL